MSVLSEILKEEYERLLRTISSYEKMVAELPKGSLREKLINGRKYCYLQWREGGKVKSKYIRQSDIKSLSDQIDRRNQFQQEIKELCASGNPV
jgi:hypothetical protein